MGCKSLSHCKEDEASIKEKIETRIFVCNVFLLYTEYLSAHMGLAKTVFFLKETQLLMSLLLREKRHVFFVPGDHRVNHMETSVAI